MTRADHGPVTLASEALPMARQAASRSIPETAERVLLTERFATIAKRFPTRVAVDVPPTTSNPKRQTWTYGELAELAQAIADEIAERVGASQHHAHGERIVAIHLSRDTPWLYAAQLAVLSLGAAFTCLDPKFPAEHVRAILEDANVAILLTDNAGVRWCIDHEVPVEAIVDVSAIAPCRGRGYSPVPWLTESRLAYLIYTSGTTGKPKGVEIEHRSIANLVAADVAYFGLGCEERVAQCSSPAYDSSIEETWLAFAVGATLVPLDDDTVRLGPDLVPWLRREGITVLCPPPTLLRTTACEEPHLALPKLKLLYVGGEALPQDLADRWGRDRWLENGYGPTECTVTVVRTRIHPGVPVTIGRAVDGNEAAVLDEALVEVADGVAGELCIAGIGLARGYRGLPEVTAQRFAHHPTFGRIYRTGDLVRRVTNGDLEYLGRIDAQVKLRGYRVELGAIDACLASYPGVRAAACRVQGDAGHQVLVAHVVLDDEALNIASLQDHCRKHLPTYMVPARLRAIAALPTSVGGKLDRKALPEILEVDATSERTTPIREATTALEHTIVEAFKRALKRADPVSIDDDFFLALGGDSLSAVGVICELRSIPALASVAVRDLYNARTAEALAKRCQEQACQPAPRAERPREPRRRVDPGVATVVQALWILFSVALSGWIWYVTAFIVLPWLLERLGPVLLALLAPSAATLSVLLLTPCAVLFTAASHRLLIGRSKPGRYPVWSATYLRHWIVEQIARLIPWGLLEGTIFVGSVLRVLGARVGERVHVHRGVALGRGAWDLLAIGDDVTLSQEATLHVMDVDDGSLVIAPVTLGRGATIGVRAGVGGGAVVGEGAVLGSLAYLAVDGPSRGVIPAGERWDGVPATKVGLAPEAPTPRDRGLPPWLHGIVVLATRILHAVWFGVALAVGVVLFAAFEAAVGSDLARWFAEESLTLSSFAVIVLTCLVAIPLSLIAQALGLRLLGSIPTGVIHRWGLDAVRVWVKSGTVDAAGRWLSGSLYWPWWLRLAGMRIGRGCEISTIIDVVPEAVTIGHECFFADGIYFCSPEVYRGTITIGATTLGSNTFLGNHAVVPCGAVYPDDLFIGVSTVADASRATPGTGWFGHPAMQLPRRDVVAADRRLTHQPSLIRYLSRLFWESLRFTLPAFPAIVVLAWYALIQAAEASLPASLFYLVAIPLITLAALLTLCVAIIGLKWVLIGRVKPGQHPLWSCWCSRWDFLFVAWNIWARNLLERLEGTVFLTWFLRGVGMKIGKDVILGDGFAQVVDPDMLTFEDGATVTCNFQAHTFEDRILKIDHLVIRRDATVGHHTVVFYGADIGERASVAPHSVVMKQETLEAGGVYAGCPAARLG